MKNIINRHIFECEHKYFLTEDP